MPELSSLIDEGEVLARTGPATFGGIVAETTTGAQAKADAAEAAVLAGAAFTGSDPVPIDNVAAAALLTLPDGAVNGLVVKVNGVAAGYGRGQPFVVLEEGAGDATDPTPAGSVLFRVDEYGGLGTNGAVHISPNLRKATPGIVQALWIEPKVDVFHLVLTGFSGGQTNPYIVAGPVAGAVFRVTAAGLTQVAAGSATAPSFSFIDNPNTGMYLNAANSLGFAVAGSLAINLLSTVMAVIPPIGAQPGTNTAPTHTFTANLNTGMYRVAPNVLGFTAGGTKTLEVGNNALGFYGTSAVAKPTGVAVNAAGIHAALVTLGLIAA